MFGPPVYETLSLTCLLACLFGSVGMYSQYSTLYRYPCVSRLPPLSTNQRRESFARGGILRAAVPCFGSTHSSFCGGTRGERAVDGSCP